ncbi:fumarylacetoacetate hydrolase family protein [Kerstersia similis]|uniref:fumarylacetoacetate hydrolase family protein n=1 Tax=Kerstersia similis TaxID=206505 RepID=UPI0039EDF7E9
MKFLNFRLDGGTHLGVMLGETHVLDVSMAWPAGAAGPAPDSVDALILAGDAALEVVRQLLWEHDMQEASNVHRYDALEILPPADPRGRNIFNVGRNYREHIIEGNLANGRPADAFPTAIEFFTKPRTALAAHGGQVLRHAGLTASLDYEVELAIVIGRGGRDIPAAEALQHVFGYTILNDITARDLQRLHGQWFKGKSLDTSCPLGPVVVHASAIADPDALMLELDVDGELRQRDSTASMIFSIATIVSSLSEGMTLLPGDVIATGTPKGVGFAMRPQRCLQAGQTVRARIEGIGELVNTVVD